MALIYRPICVAIREQLERGNIVILLGSRQVGKTSIMMLLIEEYKRIDLQHPIFYFDLEKEENLELLSNHKNLIDYLALQGADLNRTVHLFIDEFHYLPDPARLLKILHDSCPNLRIVCTGSSSLEISSKLKESLTGRKRVFVVYPLAFQEYLQFKNSPLALVLDRALREKIELVQPTLNDLAIEWEEFLLFGGYPKVTLTNGKEEKIREIEEIYSSYVQKDIKAFLRLENVIAYNKLIQILGTQIGSLTNLNQLTTVLGIARQTLERYLFVLENTFIVKRVPPLFTNKQKEIVKMHKTFFVDNGIRNYALRDYRQLNLRMDGGLMAENGAFSEMQKSLGVLHNLYFWRTQGKAEVDFVVTYNSSNVPVEVKYQKFSRPKIPASLKTFITQYHAKKGYILTRDYYGRASFSGAEIEFIPVFLAGTIKF